jgi:hypothetical protein
MRALLIVSLLTLAFAGCQMAKSQVHSSNAANPDSTLGKKPDFDADIKPIFQARCQPCHYPGGKVYDKLPFDKPTTITKLGTKVFTRIKDEKEQALIREFLAQSTAP